MDTTTKTAAPRQHLSKQQWISRSAFCFGNVGHSAFYGIMSNYFIIFVTSGMFAGLSKSVANRLIGLITGLIVGVRIIELVIDPLLGNIVDNTHTRWGKFKPWILWGNIVSGALLLVLFTGIFGLAKVNWVLFAILFVVIFITFDIFYSFSDVSYWGMVPALSEDSHERSIYTSLGAFAGTIGWNGLTIIVVPIVTTFTYLATGHRTEGPAGWFAFAAIVTLLALLSALAVCLGTKENDNIIRQSAKQKTSIKDVFSAIFHNDQIMWPALAYLMYSCAYVVTNGVLFYLYKFVIGEPGHFWVVVRTWRSKNEQSWRARSFLGRWGNCDDCWFLCQPTVPDFQQIRTTEMAVYDWSMLYGSSLLDFYLWPQQHLCNGSGVGFVQHQLCSAGNGFDADGCD